MRKCYVILGEERKTNKSWIVGVYTSLKKAQNAWLKKNLDNWENQNNYHLTTEVLR